MNIASWMYVSKSAIPAPLQDSVLDDIVAVSRRKNEQLAVTGCLIFARDLFAQILEGPPDALAILRQCINEDERHTRVHTIYELAIGSRRFPCWSLAYAGPSVFVQRNMQEALDKLLRTPNEIGNAALLQMIQEFSLDRSKTIATRG